MNIRKKSKWPLTYPPPPRKRPEKKPLYRYKVCNIIFWIENDPPPPLCKFSDLSWSRNQKHQPMIIKRLLLNPVQCTDYLTRKDNKWVIHVKKGEQTIHTHVTPQDKSDPGYICNFPPSSEFTPVFLPIKLFMIAHWYFPLCLSAPQFKHTIQAW